MGVFGANFPAMARGLVAMFWYGAQTYAASTAVALLITGVTGISGEVIFLGMTGVMWISFIFVSAFQIYLFWQGVDFIRKFSKLCRASSLCSDDYFKQLLFGLKPVVDFYQKLGVCFQEALVLEGLRA
jgi:cytosine/uracil/thiamine/allantoin permease